MKTEMGRLQDGHTKRLVAKTKEFEEKKNAIEKKLAAGSLERLRLSQKLRKLKKKELKTSELGGNDLESIFDVSSLNSEAEIERCMKEFDAALKYQDDAAAQAARLRMERRLR